MDLDELEDDADEIRPLAVNKVPVRKVTAAPQQEAAKSSGNKYQEYIDESLWNDEGDEAGIVLVAKPAVVAKAPEPALDPRHAALHALGKRYNVSIAKGLACICHYYEICIYIYFV